MKILNVTISDWANFSHDNANALRSVGLNCQDVKTNPHSFKYAQESVILRQEGIRAKMIESDIIQIFHTDVSMLNILKTIDYSKKRIFVYYCDSRYRSNPTLYNDLFNPIVEKSIIALCEFAGLGAKNETYMVGAIDVKNTPKFGHEIKEPYKIGHYPSNFEVKGTEQIIEMIQKVTSYYEFQYSVDKVSHFEQQKRMNACDIYVELFKPILNGKQYGSWGITALEAAAAGKIVVTQNLNNEVYIKNYGNCPLILCDTEQDFINNMNKLLSLSKLEISQLQTETYNWVNDKHSYIATGNRLKQILNL